MHNILARSNSDKMFGGVCGGLARYFAIDSTIVRLIFVMAIISGLSPLIYVVLWVVMPQEAPAKPAPTQPQLGPTGEWQFDPYTGQPVKR